MCECVSPLRLAMSAFLLAPFKAFNTLLAADATVILSLLAATREREGGGTASDKEREDDVARTIAELGVAAAAATREREDTSTASDKEREDDVARTIAELGVAVPAALATPVKAFPVLPRLGCDRCSSSASGLLFVFPSPVEVGERCLLPLLVKGISNVGVWSSCQNKQYRKHQVQYSQTFITAVEN